MIANKLSGMIVAQNKAIRVIFERVLTAAILDEVTMRPPVSDW